jgi:hypothetical protein
MALVLELKMINSLVPKPWHRLPMIAFQHFVLAPTVKRHR